MGLLHYLWSRTAASNATADSAVNWAEGQAPSSVNDSARAMMASIAGYRDDVAGAIVTAGTSTAYTVTSYQVFDTLAHMGNQMIAFTPHATNGATVTLNVDGLGAKPLRSAPSTELLAGMLIQGTPYVATYNNSDAAWYLQNFFVSPYTVPLGGIIPYAGSTAPNAAFALPNGQAINRTTYATLFSLTSTTYGVGNGSTTFNIPNLTGRVPAMQEASATRLTSTYFGGDSTALGATGGVESSTLGTNNLPPYTPAATTITNGAITFPAVATTQTAGSGATGVVLGVSGGGSNLTSILNPSQAATTITFTAQGGTSVPVRTVQPTLILNYIMRVL